MNLIEVKKLLDSSRGRELKEYLFSKLIELRDIDNIKEKDTATHQSIETKAQKRAYLKLREIMAEIMTVSQETKEKDPRDSFAIE